MKKLLAKIGQWLVDKFGESVGEIEHDLELSGAYILHLDHWLVAAAEEIVQQVEVDIEGAAGENKRHRAFALLCRRAPQSKHRDVSKAIEIALDHVA